MCAYECECHAMKTHLLLGAIAQIMSQHLKTLITIALLLVGHCVFGLAQLHSQEHSKANVSISISTVGLRDERQSDADIVHYKDHFYIAFAKPIQKDETAFQILRSIDGRNWKAVATLRSENEQRRPDVTYSPHYSGRPVWFSTMPSGRLCVTGRTFTKTLLWSSEDGIDWQEELDTNLSRSYSRVLWQNNRAYCAADESSSCGEKFEFFRLESAAEGSEPETTYKLSHNSHTLSGPRESQLAFVKDQAICLLAFEAYNFDKVRRWLIPTRSYTMGRLGISKGHYKEWKWMRTKLPFGSPNLLVLKDERVLATAYIDDDDARNALLQVDPTTGNMTELLKLPTVATRQAIGMTEYDGHVWACFANEGDGKGPGVLKVAKIKLGK